MCPLADEITCDPPNRAQSKAGTFLEQKQRTIALSYLRSKKQLEAVLEKRVGAVEQLRTVLRGIDNAQGDVEVCYKPRYSIVSISRC